MKRFILAILAVGLMSAACQKDPIGNTATVDMAGEWYVTVDAVDENGEVLYEDPYGMGHFIVATFNTAGNKAEELFVSDCGNFWDFKVQTVAAPADMTFATDGAVANLSYEGCNVTVTGGKITYGTGTTPSGQPADEIEFCVTFDDDDYGFTYKLHGFRYTGFTADE